MPRPKVHDSPQDRFSAYRRRAASEREEVRDLRRKTRGEAAIEPTEEKWFRVTIQIDRPEPYSSGQMTYVMAESELQQIQQDLWAYKNQATATQSIYAFGASVYGTNGFITDIPGTVSLAFYGLSIVGYAPMPGFQPSNSYAIDQSVVSFLRR